jgi:hypothetical protein
MSTAVKDDRETAWATFKQELLRLNVTLDDAIHLSSLMNRYLDKVVEAAAKQPQNQGEKA